MQIYAGNLSTVLCGWYIVCRLVSLKFMSMRTITWLAISCLTLLFIALILVIVLFAKHQ